MCQKCIVQEKSKHCFERPITLVSAKAHSAAVSNWTVAPAGVTCN